MNLDVSVSSTIPKLAWCATCEDGRAWAVCGTGVELSETGLVEGCWDGDFAAFDFENAANFFGSGLKVTGNSLCAVSATHPIDCLFILKGPSRVAVSNSLAFLLEANDIQLPVGPSYGRRFASIANGLENAENQIYLGSQGEIHRVSVANIDIRDGSVGQTAKQTSAAFDSFESYRNYLTTTLAAVFANGADPARTFPYAPLSTCSSGYDSTACSAMAAKLGCREGVTLRTARGGSVDSGRAVLEALGMDAFEFERQSRADAQDFEEAEFIATGMGGEDFIYSAFEPKLGGRVVLTGFFADAAWHIGSDPGLSFERGDNSGASLSEFRLRTGFAHLPMPVVGLGRNTQPSLLNIARDSDMVPFSVGGGYDKPVPRRIAEESGVPRALFGTSKKAASILFHRSATALSPKSLASFREFRDHAPGKGVMYLRQSIWWIWWQIWRSFFYANRKLKIRTPAKLIERALFQNFAVYEYSSPITADLLFLWSLGKVRERYRPSDLTDG